MNEQQENLERVGEKIAPIVRRFVNGLAEQRGRFTTDELLTYVSYRQPHVAADSASRILRVERQAGRLNYRCVSRSQSLYEALPVEA